MGILQDLPHTSATLSKPLSPLYTLRHRPHIPPILIPQRLLMCFNVRMTSSFLIAHETLILLDLADYRRAVAQRLRMLRCNGHP